MCPPYLSSRPTDDFGKRRNDEGRRRPPKEVNRRGRIEDLGRVKSKFPTTRTSIEVDMSSATGEGCWARRRDEARLGGSDVEPCLREP